MKQSPLSWFILIILSLVWGSSFILMKKGMEAYSSDEVAALRITIASAFLLPFLIKHYKIDFKKYALGLLLMGIFGNLIPAFLFTKAETQLSSSLTGMLNALTPLFTIIIGVLLFKTSFNKYQIIGVLIGFIGAILLLNAGQVATSTNSMYGLLVIVATLCYAISVNGIKAYLSTINSVTATIWSFTLIGPVAFIYLITNTNFIYHYTTHPKAIPSLVYISILAIIGSALSVIIYNVLIKQTGTVFASSCTYLIPIVAVFWGVLDGETVTIPQLLAMGAIIFAIYLINMPATKNKF